MGRIDAAPSQLRRRAVSPAAWIVAGGLAIVLAAVVVLVTRPLSRPGSSARSVAADAYRSLPWGSSEREAAARIPGLSCAGMGTLFLGETQRSCRSGFNIGKAWVTDELRFVGDRLLLVNGTAEHLEDWTELRDVFLAKYGPPSRSEGPSGDFASLSWETNGTRIGLSFHFGQGSGVTAMYLEWSREMREREAAASAARADEGKKAL